MSTQSTTNPDSDTKFTRGEKCLFAHLIVTFAAIIAIIIIYFVHLYVIPHAVHDMYRVSRRQNVDSLMSPVNSSVEQPSLVRCAGAVFVVEEASSSAMKAACGAALVRARWSVVSAHCVSVRATPALSHLLPHWTVRYSWDEMGASVIRGTVHPDFDADDFTSNIGLFEHHPLTSLLSKMLSTPSIAETPPSIPHCAIPTENIGIRNQKDNFIIAGWNVQDGWSRAVLHAMSAEECDQYISAVRGVMDHNTEEHCVVVPFSSPHSFYIMGSVVFEKERMTGIASWGDTRGEGLPVVVLDIYPYATWLINTISF